MNAMPSTKPLLSLMLVLASTLSGCMDSPAESTTSSGSSNVPMDCRNHPCLADAGSEYVKKIFGETGIHVLTSDGRATFTRPKVDGDLIAWSVGPEDGIRDDATVYGYNLATNELFTISAEPLHDEKELQFADGRLLFTSTVLGPDGEYSDYSHLRLWDSRDGKVRHLDVGLGGYQDSFDFDGTWALFGNRFSGVPEENGLWAMNVDTGDKLRLYSPIDGSMEGTQGKLHANSVHGGVASLVVGRLEPGAKRADDTIVTVNLQTKQATSEFVGRMGISQIEAHDGWTAITAASPRDGAFPNVFLRRPGETRFEPFNFTYAGLLTFGGDWLVHEYSVEGNAASGLSALNIRHGREARFAPPPDSMIILGRSDTDGRLIVAECMANGNRSGLRGVEICWMDLPTAY